MNRILTHRACCLIIFDVIIVDADFQQWKRLLIAFSCLFLLSCAFSGSMSVFPITTPKLMIIMAPFVFYRKCNLVCIFISLSQTIYSYNLIWAFIAFNVFDHSLLFSFVLTNSTLLQLISLSHHWLSTFPTIGTCCLPCPSLAIYQCHHYLYTPLPSRALHYTFSIINYLPFLLLPLLLSPLPLLEFPYLLSDFPPHFLYLSTFLYPSLFAAMAQSTIISGGFSDR